MISVGTHGNQYHKIENENQLLMSRPIKANEAVFSSGLERGLRCFIQSSLNDKEFSENDFTTDAVTSDKVCEGNYVVQ